MVVRSVLVSKVWRPLILWVRMVCGSDDLHDLSRLKEAVKESEALVLLQSFRVLERPCSSTATRTEVVATVLC